LELSDLLLDLDLLLELEDLDLLEEEDEECLFLCFLSFLDFLLLSLEPELEERRPLEYDLDLDLLIS